MCVYYKTVHIHTDMDALHMSSFSKLDDDARLTAVYAMACAIVHVNATERRAHIRTEDMQVATDADGRVVIFVNAPAQQMNAGNGRMFRRHVMFNPPESYRACKADPMDDASATWSAYTFCMDLIELYAGKDLLDEVPDDVIPHGFGNLSAAKDPCKTLVGLIPDSMPTTLRSLVQNCILTDWKDRLTIEALVSTLRSQLASPPHRFIIRWVPHADELENLPVLLSQLRNGHLHLYDSDVPHDRSLCMLWNARMRGKELARLSRVGTIETVAIPAPAVASAQAVVEAAKAALAAAQAALAAAKAALAAAQAAMQRRRLPCSGQGCHAAKRLRLPTIFCSVCVLMTIIENSGALLVLSVRCEQ